MGCVCRYRKKWMNYDDYWKDGWFESLWYVLYDKFTMVKFGVVQRFIQKFIELKETQYDIVIHLLKGK